MITEAELTKLNRGKMALLVKSELYPLLDELEDEVLDAIKMSYRSNADDKELRSLNAQLVAIDNLKEKIEIRIRLGSAVQQKLNKEEKDGNETN